MIGHNVASSVAQQRQVVGFALPCHTSLIAVQVTPAIPAPTGIAAFATVPAVVVADGNVELVVTEAVADLTGSQVQHTIGQRVEVAFAKVAKRLVHIIQTATVVTVKQTLASVCKVLTVAVVNVLGKVARFLLDIIRLIAIY